MNALILVDIQNDFTTGGNLPVPNGEDIIGLVNSIQGKFDLVVATQDWHPGNHKSFASNHPNQKPFDVIDLDGLHQVLWPDHCVQNSYGAEFRKELDMAKVEAVFRKGMNPNIDSYSGFFDNGRKKSTGLQGYLTERRVKNVYVCGLAGDYCVYFTAKDAQIAGFQSFIIEDAVRSISDDGFEKAKIDFTNTGGVVINSSRI